MLLGTKQKTKEHFINIKKPKKMRSKSEEKNETAAKVIAGINLELKNNYVQLTTHFETPKGEPIVQSKKTHWSLKDSYFQSVNLNTSKPDEATDIEIINSFNGARIYINLEMVEAEKIYLDGNAIDKDSLIDFLSKYTAYVSTAKEDESENKVISPRVESK